MTATLQEIERHYREFICSYAGERMCEDFVPARDLRAFALHFYNLGEERRERVERRQADRELRLELSARPRQPAGAAPITVAELSQKWG